MAARCGEWDLRDELGITVMVQVVLSAVFALMALYTLSCIASLTCRWRSWIRQQRRKIRSAHTSHSSKAQSPLRCYRYTSKWSCKTGSPHNVWWLYRGEVWEQILQWIAFTLYCESGIPKAALVVFASFLVLNGVGVIFLTCKSPRLQIEVREEDGKERGRGGGWKSKHTDSALSPSYTYYRPLPLPPPHSRPVRHHRLMYILTL